MAVHSVSQPGVFLYVFLLLHHHTLQRQACFAVFHCLELYFFNANIARPILTKTMPTPSPTPNPALSPVESPVDVLGWQTKPDGQPVGLDELELNGQDEGIETEDEEAKMRGKI